MPVQFLTRHLEKIINVKPLLRNPLYAFFMQYIILSIFELSSCARFAGMPSRIDKSACFYVCFILFRAIVQRILRKKKCLAA